MRQDLLSDFPCIRVLSLLMLLSACRPGPTDRLQHMSIPYTETAFIECAQNGPTEAVRWFLEAGMNPNTLDDQGATALMRAAVNGHDEIARLLLDHGADANAAGHKENATALALAVSRGHYAVVETLLASGAHVDPREGGQNMTPLAVAAFKGHTDIVKALIVKGADVNVVDNTGSTPLMHAADQGHPAIVKALLEGGADVNLRTEGDVTALMVAAHKGDDEIVTALIAAGAEVKVETAQGYTALMAAREEGHPQVASLLLAAGAAESQPASASWRTFVSAGRTYTVPPQWAVADPFTDHTPYWGEYAQLHTIASKDGPGTHRLLLRSPVDNQSQIFLIHGDAARWQPLLQKAFTDMEKTPWISVEQEQTDTADGVTMKYAVTRLGRGLLAGEDITYVFGVAHLGSHVFIVDAGGLTGSFDPDLVIKCIQSLHLKKGS